MDIQQNLALINDHIAEPAKKSGRSTHDILLLAVSKQQSVASIREAHQFGLQHFAENYYQEAQTKISALIDLNLTWHFIGPIQSNKAKAIANQFSWVHSLHRIDIAKKLNEHRHAELPPINVCLQINLVDEESKSGIAPEEALNLALAVEQLPHLHLRGLMTIPPPMKNLAEQYTLYRQLNDLMRKINTHLTKPMDTLSMGMSDDYVPAIEAGATIIRIGQALFGSRERKSS